MEQKTIELFFQEYHVTNPDQKAKLLLLLTDTIYEYNMGVVKLEQEKDAFKKKQIETDLQETEDKIKDIINDTLEKK
jgi:hypothetical protein